MVKRKTADLKQYMKNYKSKEKFKRRRKELLIKTKCECNGSYDNEHKNKHLKTKRHLKFVDKQLNDIVEEIYEIIHEEEKNLLPFPSDENEFYDFDFFDDFENFSDFEDLYEYENIFD